MTKRNRDIAEDWLNGESCLLKYKNLTTDGIDIFSYSTLIGTTTFKGDKVSISHTAADDMFVSQTTSCHCGLINNKADFIFNGSWAPPGLIDAPQRLHRQVLKECFDVYTSMSMNEKISYIRANFSSPENHASTKNASNMLKFFLSAESDPIIISYVWQNAGKWIQKNRESCPEIHRGFMDILP